MNRSSAVLIIVGAATRNLYRFVRWELELALDLGLEIIASNLNDGRDIDQARCPPIIRDACVVHVPFKLVAIGYALDNWPSQFRRLDASERRPRHYSAAVYTSLGI